MTAKTRPPRPGEQHGVHHLFLNDEAFDALINAASLDWKGRPIAVRASFGFQTYGPGDDLREILNSADNAMYVTKRARGTELRRTSA